MLMSMITPGIKVFEYEYAYFGNVIMITYYRIAIAITNSQHTYPYYTFSIILYRLTWGYTYFV